MNPCRIYFCILCISLPCLSWAQKNASDDILDSLRVASGSLDSSLSELVSKEMPSDPVFLYNVKMFIALNSSFEPDMIESVSLGTVRFYPTMNWETGLSLEYVRKSKVNSQIYKYCLDIGWQMSEYECVEGNKRGLYTKDCISLTPSVRLPVDHVSLRLGFRNIYLLNLRKKEMSIPLYYINMDVFRRYRLDIMMGFSFHISLFELCFEFAYPIYNGGMDADKVSYYMRSPVTVGTTYDPEIIFSLRISLFGNSRY